MGDEAKRKEEASRASLVLAWHLWVIPPMKETREAKRELGPEISSVAERGNRQLLTAS
jgi:hypothetical protein